MCVGWGGEKELAQSGKCERGRAEVKEETKREGCGGESSFYALLDILRTEPPDGGGGFMVPILPFWADSLRLPRGLSRPGKGEGREGGFCASQPIAVQWGQKYLGKVGKGVATLSTPQSIFVWGTLTANAAAEVLLKRAGMCRAASLGPFLPRTHLFAGICTAVIESI